jgi:hypothetical protein
VLSQKKTDYRYVYIIIINVVRLKEYLDGKNKLLNFHTGSLYEFYSDDVVLPILSNLVDKIPKITYIGSRYITNTAIHLYKTIFVNKNYVVAKLSVV